MWNCNIYIFLKIYRIELRILFEIFKHLVKFLNYVNIMQFPNNLTFRTCSQHEYATHKYLRRYLSPPPSHVVHGELHCLPNTRFQSADDPCARLYIIDLD